MAKFEIELDDKGEFVGALPPEFTAVVDRIRTTANIEGKGQGHQKAAEEAKAQIASAILAEKAKWDAQIPMERARWAEIEEMNKHLKTQIDATAQQSRKSLTEREEAHAAEITRRVERETRRDNKIRELVNGTLKALASRSGARDESLSELEVILQHRIGYDDDMSPYVKAEDGTTRMKTTAGNDVPLDVFVKQYLDNHPHHRKPVQAQGGGARGGASFQGGSHSTTSLESARARVENGDRSAGAISELFQATRQKRESGAA